MVNKFISATILTISMMSLGACATTATVETVPTIVPYSKVSVPVVQPIVTKPVSWKIYNKENIQALADEMQKPGNKMIIIALTSSGYKNLGSNMIEITRYIKEQKQVIVFLQSTLDSRSVQPASK